MVHFQDVITALSVAHFERKVKWNKDIIFDTQQGQVIVGSMSICTCMYVYGKKFMYVAWKNQK